MLGLRMTTVPNATEVEAHPVKRSRRTAVAVFGLATAIALSGCARPVEGDPAPVPPAGSPSTTSDASPGSSASSTAEPTPVVPVEPAGPVQPVGEPTVVATDLDLPWSLVRLASGSTLVSERDTALVKEIGANGTVREVGRVPDVVPGGEGGLLGLAVTGAFAEPNPTARSGDTARTTNTLRAASWLYAYTTAASDNRIVRMPLTGVPGAYRLGAPEVVFAGIPKAGNHNGGRIKFGPDGMLYVTAGDAGQPGRAQDPDDLGGKILRLTPEGTVPSDNPIPGNPLYSLGHRNPQGIAWDRDGRLWAAEFGQNTWDEFNLIEAGANYGWPIVEGIGNDPAYRNPVYQWSTSDASPSGLLWTADTFFLAALRGERLWAIYPTPARVDATGWFAGDFGRIRDVIDGPEGTIWILTNNSARSPRNGDDKVLEVRLGPLGGG